MDLAPAGSPPDPVGNRHWAQLNIAELAVPAGQPFQLVVWAGNPFARATRFEVVARLLRGEALRTLARIRRVEPSWVEHVPLNLWEGQRERESDVVQLTLDPGRRVALHVAGTLPDEVEPGAEVALEVVQRGAPEGEAEQVVGAMGLIVRRPAEG